MSEYVPSMDEMRAAWMVAGSPSQTVVRALQFERGIDAHDRQVKAEAWDEGYMRGMYPWSEDGQEEDPIPAYMSPPSWGQNSNPYRIESEARP